MNKFFLVVVVLCIVGPQATADNPKPNGLVSGKVVDSKGLPIEFATVALYSSADSSVIGGGLSDVSGAFSIDKLPYIGLFARVSFIGYKEYSSAAFTLTHTDKAHTLGDIVLQETAETIDEIVVAVEDDALMQTRIDKKIYNASQSVRAKGGTALDVLRDVPSVQVDENDNISLRGDGSVTILVDGRPTSMAASQYLKMLSSESVDKVEIITNPSAKYDAEGMLGILNILTKKNRDKGISGTTNATFARGINNRYRFNTSLNYRSKTLNLKGGYAYNLSQWASNSLTDRSLTLSTGTDDLITTGDELNRNLSHSINMGADYFLNDKNTVYASTVLSQNNGGADKYVSYENMDGTGTMLFASERNSDQSRPRGNIDLNAGWQNTFGQKKNTLDVDVFYSTSYDNVFEDILEETSTGTPYSLFQETVSYDDNTLSRLQADLSFPINDSTSIEAGVRNTRRTSLSRFTIASTYKDGSSTDSLIDTDFDYLQNVLAGYVSYGRQSHKWGYKLGLRTEPTFTTSIVKDSAEPFVNDYFQLFPNAHLTYQINKMNSLSASYSKRINRPVIQTLNPFSFLADRYMLEAGNPNLEPEIIHISEIGLNKNTDKVSINASLFYRYILNNNRRHLKQDGAISVVTYKNISNSSMSGTELIINYKASKFFRLMGTVNAWNYRISDKLITEGEVVNSPGMFGILNFYFTVKNGWTFQLFNNYRPRYEIQQGYMLPRYMMGVGMQKSMLKDKGKLSFWVSDVLNTQRAYFRSYPTDEYVFSGNWDWESQVAYATFSYSFGKQIKGRQKRRKHNNDVGDDSSVPSM